MQPTTYPSADGFQFTLTSISQTQTYTRYPGYSALRVIWFQHEWALPIAPEIVEQLKALQWAEKALDVEY